MNNDFNDEYGEILCGWGDFLFNILIC